MTITTTANSVTRTGNGVTTEFPYSFLIPNEASARVSLENTSTGVITEVSSGDYTITGLGSPGGGSVTYTLDGSPLSSDYKITIYRETELTQTTTVTNQTAYYPDVVESVWDKLTMGLQDLNWKLGRSYLAPVTGKDAVAG